MDLIPHRLAAEIAASRLLVLPGRNGDPAVSFAELASPDVAYNRCGQTAKFWLQHIRRGRELMLMGPGTAAWWGHAAVYVDGVVVDWTANQFAGEKWRLWPFPKEHPWVATPDEWMSSFRGWDRW